MEIDQKIALLQKEFRRKEEEEALQRKMDLYDPRKKITYTLEQLVSGIKSGEQYIYTLKLLFETRAVMNGQWNLPLILDFFDVLRDGNTSLVLVNIFRKVSVAAVALPSEMALLPLEDWVSRSVAALKGQNLSILQMKTQAVNQMEYFCYQLFTSEGPTYNIQFRILKNGQMCTGNFCCRFEDRDGMGLLLEAMVCVMEEMNR